MHTHARANTFAGNALFFSRSHWSSLSTAPGVSVQSAGLFVCYSKSCDTSVLLFGPTVSLTPPRQPHSLWTFEITPKKLRPSRFQLSRLSWGTRECMYSQGDPKPKNYILKVHIGAQNDHCQWQAFILGSKVLMIFFFIFELVFFYCFIDVYFQLLFLLLFFIFISEYFKISFGEKLFFSFSCQIEA